MLAATVNCSGFPRLSLFIVTGIFRKGGIYDPRLFAPVKILSLSFVLFINFQTISSILISTRLYTYATHGMINRDNAKFHSRFPSIARESIARPLIVLSRYCLRKSCETRDREREKERRPGTDSRIAFVRFIAAVYTA